MTLVAKATLGLNLQQSKSADLALITGNVLKDYVISLQDGTTAGKADVLFHDTRTLAPSAVEDLDLAGSLVDALGNTVTLARVKGLVVVAAAGNTNNVILGGATSNGFVSWVGAATHTVTIRPGAAFALIAGAADATGYAVTAGTGDLLHFANSGAGTSVTWDVFIWGASA